MSGRTYDFEVPQRSASKSPGGSSPSTSRSRSTSASPPKKTRANGRASRAAILEAALEVFAQRGYAGTTMAEIAARVNLTQPALLHHFRNKEQLLLEVIRGRDEAADYLNDLPVVAVIPQMIRDNLAHPLLCLLFTTLSSEAVRSDHPAHEYFVHRYRSIVEHLAAEYRSAGLNKKNAALLARETAATLDGIHQQWLLDPDEVDLEESLTFFDRRMRSTIKSLRAQGQSRGPLPAGQQPRSRTRPRQQGATSRP